MKYVFADYPNGKHTLRIGGDRLVVNEGVADVDELNPAQVALAEVYGGKPVATENPAAFNRSKYPVSIGYNVLTRMNLGD
jgi:hypothetical protein